MTDPVLISPDIVSSGPARHLWADVGRQFMVHRGGVFALVVFVVIISAVLAGPVIYDVDPQWLDMKARNAAPSLAHPLGTDNLGRDTLAQLLAGGRISLAVGVTAMLLSLLLGTAIGVLAGFVRWLDGPLMRLTDLFLALPLLPLLLVIIMLFRDTLRSLLGPEAGIFLLVIATIGLTSWMQTARLVRGEVLSVKQRDYVLAARSIGTRPHRIVTRHILPNILSAILVSATIGIAGAIITESALSFLGLGFPSDFPSWGRLLFDGINFIQITPARVLWPGLAITVTVLCVNFMGDALRDALDPRRRR